MYGFCCSVVGVVVGCFIGYISDNARMAVATAVIFAAALYFVLPTVCPQFPEEEDRL
jgi:zinc transporter ZupT